MEVRIIKATPEERKEIEQRLLPVFLRMLRREESRREGREVATHATGRELALEVPQESA